MRARVIPLAVEIEVPDTLSALARWYLDPAFDAWWSEYLTSQRIRPIEHMLMIGPIRFSRTPFWGTYDHPVVGLRRFLGEQRVHPLPFNEDARIDSLTSYIASQGFKAWARPLRLTAGRLQVGGMYGEIGFFR